MNSLLFPGQGSQVVGMGSEFFNNFNLVKKIFKEADEKLNFSISKIILEGPSDQLQLTKNTQPAILTVSYSIYETLKKEFNFDFSSFKFFAGHSLGEYSALVCSDSLKFEDALYLLHQRGKAMQEAVPVGLGSMVAILGTKIDLIKEIINFNLSKDDVCEIANDNAEGQVIISGKKDSVERVEKVLKEKKIKSIQLKVSAPFHCSMMQPAADAMMSALADIEIRSPSMPLVANVTAAPTTDPAEIRRQLIEQVCGQVRWRESVEYMAAQGVVLTVEAGAGKVLSVMNRRTAKEIEGLTLGTPEDIETVAERLG